MFKGLRDRLKDVSDKMEEELEARLEAELEAELAQAMSGSDAGAEAPVEEAELEAELAGTAVAEPAEVADPEPALEPAPVAEPVPGPAAAPEPDPVVEEPTPSEPAPPAAPETVSEPTPTGEPGPPPTPTPTPEPAPAATAATPAVEKPKPQHPITGRKQLSEEEIEARLLRELGEAVEVQKEVERTVEEVGGTVQRYTINEDVLDDILWELEVALLESDVALPVIEAIKKEVREQLLSMSVGGKSPGDVVEKVLRSAIRRVLQGNTIDFDQFIRDRHAAGKKPVVVMFVGVNGTGKTTSIARMSYRLQQNGISTVLAAGDTFRAGAIEQLSQHANKLGVKVIKHSEGADPAAVAYDAIEHAKARHKDVVLLDTAGRMQTNSNLMDEMDKIRRVADPDMVIFVGDSLAGNDAVEQARRFDEVVDIDGVILTKTDVDAKGGAALSVAYTINKPLLFIGVGQDYPDLEPFSADTMVARLFGDD